MNTNNIWKAVRDNNVEYVKKYIDQGGDINVVDKDNYTLLMDASIYIERKEDVMGMVKLLLDAGIDTNIVCNTHYLYESPLHRVVGKKKKYLVQQLIGGGFNVNLRSSTNRTPFYYAVRNLSIDFWLDETMAYDAMAYDAIITNVVDIVCYLIENGADISTKYKGKPLDWHIKNSPLSESQKKEFMNKISKSLIIRCSLLGLCYKYIETNRQMYEDKPGLLNRDLRKLFNL